MFASLNNPALFQAVKVEQGGYAVVWNSDIGINEMNIKAVKKPSLHWLDNYRAKTDEDAWQSLASDSDYKGFGMPYRTMPLND